MRGTRWPVRGFVLLLTACGGGSSSSPPEPAEPGRLEILHLSVPVTVPPGREFTVEVLVGDPVGIASVEFELGAQRQVLTAGDLHVGTLRARFTAGAEGLVTLHVVAVGTDGARGAGARALVTVGDDSLSREGAMDGATLRRRVEEWDRKGLTEDESYPRGPLYKVTAVTNLQLSSDRWWIQWRSLGGPQPFDWATYCPGATGVTSDGEVLRCWLALNPEIAVRIRWERILPNGQVQGQSYPFWSEARKQEFDHVFSAAYRWIESGLQTPFPIPPDPSFNQVPPDFSSAVTALNEHDAWLLWSASIAHCLALEIGGFVPWSILDYDLDDVGPMLHSRSMFFAGNLDFGGGFSYTGYWCHEVVHAYPKTSFQFFIDQDIIRPTHQATIARLLAWSGGHLVHSTNYGGDTDGKTSMEAAYMHWQYHGCAPVQRVLAGTIRENRVEVQHWTRGCPGTSHLYQSILRALNIPATTLWGWGEGQEPHLDGHTVPVFPTIGKTMSHADEILAWDSYAATVSPPPGSMPASKVLIPWATFVDWFYDHPDSNVGRRRSYEVALEVLDDKILDLYCADLGSGLPLALASVYQRFSKHYTIAELQSQNLWTRLAQKAAALNHCGD